MALRPESTKRSSRRKAVGSSTVQPKTLPPRTSGAMRRPERPRVRRPMEGLKRGGRERIAVLRPAGIQAALEPAHALRGRAVREGLRHHAPLRLFLQTVVADRRRGVERLGDIARIELVHRAGVVSPYAGIAVGLELHAHRGAVLLGLRARARRFHLLERPRQLLHVMADLVRDYVGLGKVPRSEEHTSELQSRFGISYAVFCLKKKQDALSF